MYKNVGIYCRVSSGLREQLNSLSAQASGFVRWVAANNSMRLVDMYGFEKYARKYGVDYAITKDRSVVPPKYLVFFKARDADAMTAAFNAYSAEILTKSGRPSVLKALHKMAEVVKDIPAKVVSREKQRQQSR